MEVLGSLPVRMRITTRPHLQDTLGVCSGYV